MGYVMRQLIVEMGELEMAELEAAARARGIDPEKINKAQLLQLLEALQLCMAGPNATATQEVQQGTVPRARAERLAALMSMHGIWKGDPDQPQDGVAYQQEVRAEWR